MLLIKNARLVNPANKFDQITNILIKDNKVEKIASIEELNKCYSLDNIQHIDANKMVVAPGLIDIHVHFRDPGFTHKEDILTGAQAAAAGGFTSVICMANTKPIVDNIETLREIRGKAKDAVINVHQSAAITKGFGSIELADMKELLHEGATGFSNDGFPITNTRLLKKAMLKAKKLDQVLAFHEEDNNLLGAPGINEGCVSEELQLKGAPRVAEDVMIARDCLLAEYTGAKIDIQHISSGSGVDIVRRAQKRGVKVFAEASPHHFTLTEDAVKTHGTLAKMNPPLRTEWDRQEIIKGLQDNTISIIATDHAPHTYEEKNAEFTKAPSGIIGLETSLALGITELVEKNYLSLNNLLEKMTINPSNLYKLDRGDLSEGKVADIVIFDPDEIWTVNTFKSKSQNSPFIERKLKGKVKYTICNGKIVYKDK